jgi:hypothetical protein
MHNLYADFIYGSESYREATGSTHGDSDRAEANEIGSRHPERCWILTDRDVWHLNPYFNGEIQRHPEDCPDEDEEPDSEPTNPAPEFNWDRAGDYLDDVPEGVLYRI